MAYSEQEKMGRSLMAVDERLPLLQKLKNEREALEHKLAEYNAAIEALEKNPEFETMINTLSKVARGIY